MSLRLRIVVASTLAMALVLAALGAFVRARTADGLDAALDRALDARIADVAAAVAGGGTPALGPADEDAVVVQILAPDGRVVAASGGLAAAPLLGAADRARAAEDDVLLPRVDVAVTDDGDAEAFPARLAARAADDDAAGSPVVVAAIGTEDRDATLRTLDTALLVGLPAALALAALLSWALAAAALRPVEAMRRRAAAIDAPSDERLPVPAARDEIGRLGRTLNAMLDRQAAGFRRERAFAADASHELRTPLSVLRAELDLAGRGERSADELRAALASASEETRRLERLADDLLALARADAAPRAHAAVPVRPLLEAVRDRCAAAYADADRSLDVADDADGGAVTGDRDDLERALGGLVDNALRHGDGPTEITARRSPDGDVTLHVLDRGPGVPDALRPHVFERFVTGAAERRQRRGTGLGLAIVAQIAAAHGGRAGIDARPGGGADAWIALSSNSHGAPPSVVPR
nr:HAMP domain-containing sensor histidine kinase [Patulibacter sp. SYSU D01012]